MYLSRILHSNIRPYFSRHFSYFKITNQQEKHHDHQYFNGLNILKGSFAKVGSCCPGGFYYTDSDHIPEFFSYGTNLRRVSLPLNDPDLQIVPDNNKWRSNKIIFEEKYSLFGYNKKSTYCRASFRNGEY
jgi:hypothetical protein